MSNFLSFETTSLNANSGSIIRYCEETGDFLIPDHRVLEPTKFQLFAEFQRMKKAQTTGCCAIV